MITVAEAWTELLAEVGAECDMDRTWCSRHQASGTNGRCSTGRALDEMAVAIANVVDRP